MKKVTRILMLTILVFTLSNCAISTKKANVSEKYDVNF
jgi:PBP1b-binding outer membrane lipoprotein LpoB